MSKVYVWLTALVLLASLNAQACPAGSSDSRGASAQRASSVVKQAFAAPAAPTTKTKTRTRS